VWIIPDALSPASISSDITPMFLVFPVQPYSAANALSPGTYPLASLCQYTPGAV